MPPILALFSSLVSRLWLPLPGIPKQNTLAGLPVELLLSIADSLPWDDVGCLSLCCRRLFALLHPRKTPVLLSKEEKISFLMRLERDIPTCFTCHSCQLLHKCDGPTVYGRVTFDWASFVVSSPRCSSERKNNPSLRLVIDDSANYHVY